jgi:hypothetical protein
MIRWYRLVNRQDFIDTGLPSFEAKVNLESIGETTVIVTRGVGVSLFFQDAFLPVNLNGKNPFRFGLHSVYVDQNDDLWLGVIGED